MFLILYVDVIFALLDALLADVIDASCKFDMAMLQVLEFGKKS